MEIQESVLLRRVGRMDPVSVPEFEALGGFSGIRKALSMEKEEILEEISRSNLKGRGGAGYPAGRKWKSLYRIEGDTKYIVCNADEGEPGTFKDRVLLEETPLSVIEGMLIAGYVFGSTYAESTAGYRKFLRQPCKMQRMRDTWEKISWEFRALITASPWFPEEEPMYAARIPPCSTPLKGKQGVPESNRLIWPK